MGLTFRQSPIKLGAALAFIGVFIGETALLYALCRLLGREETESTVPFLTGAGAALNIIVPCAGSIESIVPVPGSGE